MPKMLLMSLALLIAPSLGAADLAGVTRADATAALKTALTQGARKSVDALGRQDGFFGNPEVKIPLPANLSRIERRMRRFGFGAQADELILALNRAAEAAVPEAKTLLIDAVKTMSVEDARSILSGGDDAATLYFKSKTQRALADRFKPIVANAMSKVGVASSYNALAGKAAQFGMIDAAGANLDDYVTAQALDGLFEMIAAEELAIRKNPLGESSKLLRRVFGAL